MNHVVIINWKQKCKNIIPGKNMRLTKCKWLLFLSPIFTLDVRKVTARWRVPDGQHWNYYCVCDVVFPDYSVGYDQF